MPMTLKEIEVFLENEIPPALALLGVPELEIAVSTVGGKLAFLIASELERKGGRVPIEIDALEAGAMTDLDIEFPKHC